jgi:hypothetical protein
VKTREEGRKDGINCNGLGGARGRDKKRGEKKRMKNVPTK